MAVATWQEVAVALGRPASDFNTDQQAQITWWLDGVEIHLRSRLGDVAALDADVVRYVEVEVAARKAERAQNKGASSITVNVDDGGVTRRFENPVTAEDIGDNLWGLFTPDLSASAYTIAVSSPLDQT